MAKLKSTDVKLRDPKWDAWDRRLLGTEKLNAPAEQQRKEANINIKVTANGKKEIKATR